MAYRETGDEEQKLRLRTEAETANAAEGRNTLLSRAADYLHRKKILLGEHIPHRARRLTPEDIQHRREQKRRLREWEGVLGEENVFGLNTVAQKFDPAIVWEELPTLPRITGSIEQAIKRQKTPPQLILRQPYDIVDIETRWNLVNSQHILNITLGGTAIFILKPYPLGLRENPIISDLLHTPLTKGWVLKNLLLPPDIAVENTINITTADQDSFAREIIYDFLLTHDPDGISIGYTRTIPGKHSTICISRAKTELGSEITIDIRNNKALPQP